MCLIIIGFLLLWMAFRVQSSGAWELGVPRVHWHPLFLGIKLRIYLQLQSPSNAYKRFWFYAMKMGYLKFNFHTLVMLQFVWAPGSKQTLIRPFQKCTVHVCSLNDSKVMKRQSSRPPKKMRLRRSSQWNHHFA